MIKYVKVLFYMGIIPCFGQGIEGEEPFLYGTFPPDFRWGLGSSSFQSEGAAYKDGKGLTAVDNLTNIPELQGVLNTTGCPNVEIAADSYHKIMEDTQLLKDVGVNFYRFSIAWARIIPTGRVRDGINQAGINHYNRLIDSLIGAGIEPFVTLFHWDLPLPLEWEGAFKNHRIIHHFHDYAKVAFKSFGDRVKFWTTFNEPRMYCMGLDFMAGIKQKENLPKELYDCNTIVIKAHALAWRLYDKEFRSGQGGKVGASLVGKWPEPKDPANPSHVAASNRLMEFQFGIFANPLLRGEYPPIMRKLVDEKSAQEGRTVSRLPSFDAKWTKIINGTLDFIGLNYYFADYTVPGGKPKLPGIEGDADVSYKPPDPAWPQPARKGWSVTPFGMRKILGWFWKEYKMPIYITENGYTTLATDPNPTNDPERVDFYKHYINNVLKAVTLDGVHVKGYIAWSLADYCEFNGHANIKYGVHYVNYSNPNLPRTPKDSALYLKKVFADNGFPSPESAKPVTCRGKMRGLSKL